MSNKSTRYGKNLQAAQLAEVYWMALLRDVPFSQYGVNEDTIAAAGNETPAMTRGTVGFAPLTRFIVQYILRRVLVRVTIYSFELIIRQPRLKLQLHISGWTGL